MTLQKRENESIDDWKYRLLELKINKEIDEDWVELKDLLKLEETTDSIRKKARGAIEYKQYLDNKSVDSFSNEVLDELKEKTKEFEIAKLQFQDQKREYKHYLRHEGRLDHLLKTMLESIKEEMNTKKPLEWVKPIEKSSSNGALTLLLSDLHKGMVTDNHWNKYDNDVFYTRLNQVTQEVLEYQTITNTKEIHVFELGDIISGVIHRMTKLSETENAVDSTQKVAEALSELLSVLANRFEKVHYYNVKGNHDRVAARKEEEVKTESFHSFIAWYMKVRLDKHENIVFHDNEIDSEIIVAEILGKNYFAVHGHLDGLGKVVQDLTMMTQRFPTCVFMGHYHRNYENEIHSVDLIMNGSFGGTDDYAKDKRLTSKAHQKLLWLDENGRRATFYIHLK